MKRVLLFCLTMTALVTGCSQNHFNVPTETFATSVRALGVAPIIVDTTSDIRHPQKEQLIPLLGELNRKYEQQFVRKLKTTGNFYTIALIDGEPQDIFSRLYSRRERRDDAAVVYNKYFWKNDELKSYLQKNNLDAVMLLVVSGLTKNEKVTAYTQFKSLSSDYNYLVMSAQIVDVNGSVLWEYPNFRQRFPGYDPLLNLEYPDFNEAEANLTTNANVKFKTIEGIRRALEQKRKDWLLRETQEPEIYGKQFDAMLSLLAYDHDSEKKSTVPVVEPPRSSQPTKSPEAKNVAPATVAPAPAVQAPAPQVVQPPAVTRVPVLDKSAAPPADEIVPAKGSTL